MPRKNGFSFNLKHSTLFFDMRNFAAAIFDMDGLLLDSERLALETFQTTCLKFNTGDLSELFKQCLGTNSKMGESILKNGLQGILLVFIVLALFLDLGLAFWVSSGIPISFMGAFLVLSYFGASINMLSLFGFIMTLGILVDDAIIVGENVYTHYKTGKSAKVAVIDSIAQIGAPVVMAVTTTIVAFTPLMHIAGIMGKFIFIMPQAVICILAFSLVEAFIILPAHLYHALTPPKKNKALIYRVCFFWLEWLKKDIFDAHNWMRDKVEKILNVFIYSIYTPVLKYCAAGDCCYGSSIKPCKSEGLFGGTG